MVDCNDPLYGKYQFGYFKTTDLIDTLKEFQISHSKELRLSVQMTLIDADYVFDNTHYDQPGFEPN